ncbi:MAG TPA: YggS family pyridoxal phosphate-dependent enzyme [Clostridia bacterium]|jgi:pyridoxal phosphate enzyme (YggS family)|nr:YggS family pyridoxal phosphate-dependent enzyme [Clostridia bacterium]HOK81502.1 YggS family pyridoxal phosphate-dependent enzyme [Clostridia bacterium]HOL60947.1 YggS family pyridoxal phosphate-dependent enzyme [Clostridia bacterium]HPO53460.1 YggS family pyridoxal phosphate-dependent enzyme [Clostridia bacterium]
MEKILANLELITRKINEAAAKAGKSPDEIEIVAASKTRDIDTLKKLYATGRISAFGENRAQEFLSKYTPELKWDFIGQLQTNKVKYLIGKVRLIHSVDRDSLAAEIDRLANKNNIVQDVLIEINSGAEEAKGGLLISEVEPFAKSLERYPNLRLRGVMAVAPREAETQTLKKLFMGVREVYERLKSDLPCVDILSMGMSGDFELAIECGSNLIRPGRVLFD